MACLNKWTTRDETEHYVFFICQLFQDIRVLIFSNMRRMKPFLKKEQYEED